MKSDRTEIGKTLFIYGNSGAGKNLLYAIEATGQIGQWDKIAFLNDSEHDGQIMGHDVVSFEESLSYDTNRHEYVVSVGEPAIRKKLYQKIQEAQLNSVGIYAAPYPLPASSHIGNGSIVHLSSIITMEASVGDNCLINYGVLIGHNVSIGNHCVISPNTVIGGFAEIGDGTYIGNGVAIRDRVKIGKDCIIGMGSVVTKDIPDHEVWVGNPARFLRRNTCQRVFK